MNIQRNSRPRHGFTLVEVVMVIFVMATLALIVNAWYGGWQQNAATKQVKSDLTSVAGAMESSRNFSTGYPTSLPSTFTPSPNVTMTYAYGSTTSYCINASSSRYATIAYYISSTTNAPTSGTCP